MIPFKSPPLVGGGPPPLIQNYPGGQYVSSLVPPVGAKFVTIEALSSGAPGYMGGDDDANGSIDYCGAGAGGAYASITYPRSAITSTMQIKVESRIYPDAAGGPTYVYFDGVGYGLYVQPPYDWNTNGSAHQVLPGYTASAFIRGQSGQDWTGNNVPGGDVNLRGGAAASGGSLVDIAGLARTTSFGADTDGFNYGGGGALQWRPYNSLTRGAGGAGYVRLTWTF